MSPLGLAEGADGSWDRVASMWPFIKTELAKVVGAAQGALSTAHETPAWPAWLRRNTDAVTRGEGSWLETHLP